MSQSCDHVPKGFPDLSSSRPKKPQQNDGESDGASNSPEQPELHANLILR